MIAFDVKKLQRISAAELSEGMTVAVGSPYLYGWGTYTGLWKFQLGQVTHISPQRNNFAIDGKNMRFRDVEIYHPCPAISEEMSRFQNFTRIMRGLDKVQRMSATHFIGTLEEMQSTAALIEKLVQSSRET